MSPTPKQSIDPSFIQDMDCPICGQDALQLKAMERYPDYVACGDCQAQFVAEAEGERVMYGEIPVSYPRTRRFALQQWAWPEAIARRAAEERAEQPSAPPADQPTTDTAESEVEATTPPPEPQIEGAEPPTPDAAELSTPTEERTPDEEPPPWQPPEAPEVDEPSAEPTWSPEEEEDQPEGRTPLPAFDETDQEEAGDLPAEDEPAAEMDDWLSEPAEPAAEAPAEDVENFEETALRDEDELEGDEEAMFAALWGDEEPDADLEESDDLAPDAAAEGFEFDAFDDEEGQLEEPDLADDIWAENEEGEVEATAPVGFDETEPESEGLSSDLSERELAALEWTGEAEPTTQEAQPTEEEGLEAAGPAAEADTNQVPSIEDEPERRAIEPPPGVRHRVVLKTSQPTIPDDRCAHCTQSPTVARISVPATVVRGTGLGERQVTTFRVPICADCRQRVNARSEGQQTARLQAHLISLLVALILVVSALAFQVVDLQEGLLVDLAALALLGGMGYVVPAAFLLLRASRMPKPADARYVETTLRVPSDTQGMETAFEWRSPHYAAHFRATNAEVAAGDVTEVKQREQEPTPELEIGR